MYRISYYENDKEIITPVVTKKAAVNKLLEELKDKFPELITDPDYIICRNCYHRVSSTCLLRGKKIINQQDNCIRWKDKQD